MTPRGLLLLLLAGVLAGCTGGGATVPVVENPQSTGPNVPRPQFTGITPTSGFANSTVTITGSGFGDVQGGSSILFTGTTTAATIVSWSNTRIVAQVVSTAATGPLSFKFDGIILANSAFSYTVLEWISRNQEVPSQDYFGLSFINSNLGWAVGAASTILRFENDDWNAQAAPVAGRTLRDVAMASATAGLICGGDGTGVVFSTADGGQTWVDRSGVLPAPNNQTLLAVAVSGANGWVVGNAGTIFRTADGGATWANQSGVTGANLRGVDFVDALNGFAVGDGGVILRTANGGTTWTNEPSPTTRNLFSVFAASATLAYAVGQEGTILKLSGGTWTDISVAQPQTFRDVFFLADGTTGWVCGTNQVLLFTNDGGATWTFEDVGGTQFDLQGLFFTSRENGWVVGLSRTLSRTQPKL